MTAMHLALPVAVQRCALGCSLYLRRHGLVALAVNAPEHVRLVVCEPCFNTLAAAVVSKRKGA